MATKPTDTFYEFAFDTNFASGPESGNPTKQSMTEGAQKQGLIAGLSYPGQNMNYVFNIWSKFLGWVNSGASTGAEDAHIIETDSNGDTAVAGLDAGPKAAGNDPGATCTGAGLGAGVVGIGGSTAGVGVQGTAVGGNTVGILGTGSGSGPGVRGSGAAGAGPGVDGVGGAAMPGVEGTGGTTGAGVAGVGGPTDGTGVQGTGGATNGTGVQGIGTGTGPGVLATAGSGDALRVEGGDVSIRTHSGSGNLLRPVIRRTFASDESGAGTTTLWSFTLTDNTLLMGVINVGGGDDNVPTDIARRYAAVIEFQGYKGTGNATAVTIDKRESDGTAGGVDIVVDTDGSATVRLRVTQDSNDYRWSGWIDFQQVIHG